MLMLIMRNLTNNAMYIVQELHTSAFSGTAFKVSL